jgi:hypothetical protein
MEIRVFVFITLHYMISFSEQFEFNKNTANVNEHYKVKLRKGLGFKPIIHYIHDNELKELSDEYAYDVLIPEENDQKYDLLIERTNENFEDHIIIQSKAKSWSVLID